jgi:transposase
MEHKDFTYCPRHRDTLPRENALLAVEDKVRACCGGTLHPIGESVGEMLDWMAA